MSDKPQKQDTKLVKCPKCESKVPKNESIQHRNKRYYHKECYEEITKESNTYKELISYICELYKVKHPSGQMLNQIKNYKNNLNYTNKGMELTLRYYYDILDNKVDDNNFGLSVIIPNYKAATKQYINKMNVANSITDDKLKTNKIEVKVSSKSNQRDKKLIDMDLL